ncbi:MAG: hypothetical protein WBL73_01950 [bacterium]
MKVAKRIEAIPPYLFAEIDKLKAKASERKSSTGIYHVMLRGIGHSGHF